MPSRLSMFDAVTRDISFINRSLAPPRPTTEEDTYGNPNYSADVRAWLTQTNGATSPDSTLPPNSIPHASGPSPFATADDIAARQSKRRSRPTFTSTLSHDYSASHLSRQPSDSRRRPSMSHRRQSSYTTPSPVSPVDTSAPSSSRPVAAYAEPSGERSHRREGKEKRPSMSHRVSSSSAAAARTASYGSERRDGESRRKDGRKRSEEGRRSGESSGSGYADAVEGYRSHVYRR